MKASKTSLNCNKIGNLSMTLVLDKRTNKNTEIQKSILWRSASI